MRSSQLFSPITLGGIELSNRIVVAPMCQYSADDGSATDWHLMHLGQFAVSGVGLILVEATGVSPEARISPGCLGLWSDDNQEALARVVGFCRDYGNATMGIQLAHAGRKASTDLPWYGGAPIPAADPRGWQTVAPSAAAYNEAFETPTALDDDGLAKIVDDFVAAARRADEIGFDVVEVHMAHGYLMHQFLSPLSNQRNDAYGGALEGRMRFPLEVFAAVRAVWPKTKALGVRISATDWVEGSSWTVEEASRFTAALYAAGADFIDVSSGGNSPAQQIEAGPGYQTGFAATIRREVGIPTMAVGQITEPRQAEAILRSGQADMVALARGMLFNPRWAWHAAEALDAEATFAPQYMRSSRALRGEPVPGNPPVKARKD
ncbi:MAG TPA: oxidoreductase [Alphaproteobacteria bacterium]|nr:oxidoreductase [Alphaproteobacteria bacterium]